MVGVKAHQSSWRKSMKKFSLFILFLLIIFISVPVSAKRISNWIELSSGISITGIGGASVYIVDLRSPAYDPVTRGDFGVQLAGVTCAYTSNGSTLSSSGATINAHFAEINHLNIGTASAAVAAGAWVDANTIASKLNWQAIFTNLAYDSGNTEYGYGFDPEKLRYIALRFTTGVTDMYIKIYLDMD